MRGTWSGLGLLLVVPWLASCVSGPQIRLDTGHGAPIVYTPPADQPPPVEIRQEEFVSTLTDIVLHTPLSLGLPRREGRMQLASWGGEPRDPAQQMLERQCAPSEPPEGCLVLPGNAPPPETLARMRLALSFAMDSVWEGAAVPISEYLDPLAFKVMLYTALSTYLLTLMMPDPVTKGLAAVLTLYLVAYLGLGPVWSMVEAGWRLLEESERAMTVGELKQAGHRFGRVLGDNGMRVFLLLATAALGGQTNFVGRGPGLPGFRQAALASPARTRVSLEAAGQVRTVVLGAKELVVGLAPTAVATNAMGPGGGAPPKKGSLIGQPKHPGPKADEETVRGFKRENESARILAENGYDVEQNPLTKSNGKKPDYKINGEYA
ncbi:hypothetical protein, partial [Archangium sp.]|uniref:SitA5 family polymorphic toxin n=1 Tax=Archangium sp. TaxID=1872627 RepID=UPI002D5E9332